MGFLCSILGHRCEIEDPQPKDSFFEFFQPCSAVECRRCHESWIAIEKKEGGYSLMNYIIAQIIFSAHKESLEEKTL